MEGKALVSLKERIAEKVGTEFMELIPEDEWQQLINAAVDDFRRNELPGIIKQTLRQEAGKKIAEHLSETLSKQEWDGVMQRNVNPAIQELIVKAGPELFAAMLAPMFTQMFQDMMNRINSGQQFY